MSVQPGEEAFLKLVDDSRQRILRICRVYAWSAPDQEDLYQEILVQIWRGLPKLREPRYAKTWLYRVALNTAISFVRKGQNHRKTFSAHQDQLRVWAEERQSQAAEAGPDPQVERLYEALGRLNRVERALMTLYLDDLSYGEIAEVMGMNSNQVGVMLHRTKKKLSDLMQEVPA